MQVHPIDVPTICPRQDIVCPFQRIVALRERIGESLPIENDGTIRLVARAWAVRDKVP